MASVFLCCTFVLEHNHLLPPQIDGIKEQRVVDRSSFFLLILSHGEGHHLGLKTE